MTENLIAAIRDVAATIQQEIDSGRRSTAIDANDLIEILLAIAENAERGLHHIPTA